MWSLKTTWVLACPVLATKKTIFVEVDLTEVSYYFLKASSLPLTVKALRAAFPRLVDGVDTWWRSTVCYQTAGNAVTVTGTLLTLCWLEEQETISRDN